MEGLIKINKIKNELVLSQWGRGGGADLVLAMPMIEKLFRHQAISFMMDSYGPSLNYTELRLWLVCTLLLSRKKKRIDRNIPGQTRPRDYLTYSFCSLSINITHYKYILINMSHSLWFKLSSN